MFAQSLLRVKVIKITCVKHRGASQHFSNLGPDIVKMLQFLGPKLAKILQFPGPEIAVMLQSDFWAQKLLLCLRDPLWKGSKVGMTPRPSGLWTFLIWVDQPPHPKKKFPLNILRQVEYEKYWCKISQYE